MKDEVLGTILILLVTAAIGSVSLASQLGKPTASSSSTLSTCALNWSSAGAYLRLISDSTQQPLPGISVHVLSTGVGACYFTLPGPTTYNSNASGWIFLGTLPGGYRFEVSLEYAARGYNFSIPQISLDVA